MKFQQELDNNKYTNDHLVAYLNLLYTTNWVELKVKKVLSAYKITHQQYNILKILKGSYPVPLSANDIKERMMFKSPDVTRLMDRLEKKGYVSRKLCASNRRKIDLVITEEGIQLIEQLSPALAQIIQQFFKEKISVPEAQMLHRLLNKIRH